MAAATYVGTNKIKRYDIFKNTVSESEVTAIKQLLANLAVADTSHDIDKKDKGVFGITDNLNDINDIQAKMYKKGIPIHYNSIPSEEESISSVIDKSSFEWMNANFSLPGDFPINGEAYPNDIFKGVPYLPLIVMKYIKEGKIPQGSQAEKDTLRSIHVRNEGTRHNITTVNGNKYVVTYFDVKPEINGGKGIFITAETFFKRMGYADTITAANAGTKKNIAFVVDCTSVKIEDILNKGTRIREGFRTYLIKSPEGENDPGGKTNLQDK